MDRFVTKVDRSVERVQHAMLEAARSAPPKKRRKVTRSGLTHEEKVDLYTYYKKHGTLKFLLFFFDSSPLLQGYKGTKLRFGPRCPPQSTIATWAVVLEAGGRIEGAGRPCLLTKQEEEHVVTTLRALRDAGAVLDAEVLCLIGQEACKQLRGCEITLDKNWAHSFRCLPSTWQFLAVFCWQS